jgi:hypothetical protein
MPKKSKASGEKSAKDQHISAGGVVYEGNVVTGRKTKLTAKEQGQLARGEIDEAGEPTGKKIEPKGEKVVEAGETLYVGQLSAEATSTKTGQKVSYTWVQGEPVTEEGCYRVMESAHGVGSLKRETFKLDPENEIDPTLRTPMERP